MDSEDDTKDDVDSGNESSGDDVDFAMDVETHSTRERQTELEEYPYEVLSTDEIVQHMVDCIKEVNTVVEVSMLVVNNGLIEWGYSNTDTSIGTFTSDTYLFSIIAYIGVNI